MGISAGKLLRVDSNSGRDLFSDRAKRRERKKCEQDRQFISPLSLSNRARTVHIVYKKREDKKKKFSGF
jgi:hypothetical protein